MRISTRGRYSMRMMVDIARHGGCEKPVSLGAVSRRVAVSHGYLEQLARAQREAGLLRSVTGRYGGYALARPAPEISARQVLEAAIGAISVADCTSESDRCVLREECESRAFFELVERRLKETMDAVSLADLAEPDWRRRLARCLDDEPGRRS